MKFYVVLLVVLALLSLAHGAPSKGSTKASLKKKQSCVKDCGDTYKPICAGDGGKNISFGSECVLANYNCENQKDLKLVSQGECPGGGGVRLS
ncbi:turripeptide Lol9.1-like [Euwallacea similis]|uniref:turripeptide Lol9.1-like n=1 Tax=Euwallacea similis TaxID=1736056 RepID=UPI00344DA66C